MNQRLLGKAIKGNKDAKAPGTAHACSAVKAAAVNRVDNASWGQSPLAGGRRWTRLPHVSSEASGAGMQHAEHAACCTHKNNIHQQPSLDGAFRGLWQLPPSSDCTCVCCVVEEAPVTVHCPCDWVGPCRHGEGDHTSCRGSGCSVCCCGSGHAGHHHTCMAAKGWCLVRWQG